MALAAAAAGGLAAAAYLDGKYQLTRDFSTILRMKQAERLYNKKLKEDRISPWYFVEDRCKLQPNDRAIWTRERSWTYQEMYDHTLQLAQWMIDEGIRPGDLVAFYLHNSAHFLMLLFATWAVGASAATINYNLEGQPLMHCLSVTNSKLIIVDSDSGCQQRINESKDKIEAAGTKIATLDSDFIQRTHLRPIIPPDDQLRRGWKPGFPFVLLFTSGTTGLPKGTPFTTSRTHLLGSPEGAPPFGGIRGKDCWYSPMPLYHGTGLMTTSLNVCAGVGCAIPPRFSVSNFWPDIYDSGSTMFIYVGETARYLLAAPPHPLERAHNLKVIYGNGLRPDVWHKFQQRFNIPEVAEFFNSSEGVFALLVWARNNYLNACVGHHGGLLRALLHNTFIPVQIDYESGDIWRDPKTGFAKRMPYEEGGEMIVQVPAREAFGGYWNNPEATEKRFATNVFKKGDLYYRSGDALRRDPDGHWHFMDRLGDTFRWKSENVSTAEVAEVLGRYPGISEANVFGVTVPGHEGRAGCAAIDVDGSQKLDYADLVRYARKQLPSYAVPVFLRVVKGSSHIHNHKQNKVGLRREGVDPDKAGTEETNGAEDAFLWWKPGTQEYVPFERKDWEKLVNREVRL